MRRYRGVPVPQSDGGFVIYEAMPAAPVRDSLGMSRTVHYTQAAPNNPLQQIADPENDIIRTYTQGCAMPPGRLSYAYPLR